MITKTKQLPLLKAETSWFHVFKSMIDNLDAAKMGGTTFLIYAVIKAHTNWSTGKSFPKIETIMEKSGSSKDTVLRSLKTLEEMDYIRKEKVGRSNQYTLLEKVTIEDVQGRPQAVALFDYLPSTVKAAQAELKNFLLTGDATNNKIIHIDSLTLNVQVGNNNTQFNISDIKDEDLQELIKRIDEKRKNKGENGADR